MYKYSLRTEKLQHLMPYKGKSTDWAETSATQDLGSQTHRSGLQVLFVQQVTRVWKHEHAGNGANRQETRTA